MRDNIFRPVPQWYRKEKEALRGAENPANYTDAPADGGARGDITQLDIKKLFMITEAMWDILKEKHGYTDENLLQMIHDIDLRDGELDGNVAKQRNQPCARCGRVLMGQHPVCLYCGAMAVKEPFER